ncbi:PepSY domain-containing protein [Vibrio caribbeanicus]|uniref:PepSY domain-containing protein n=1 Tax=Vibrio caribbeanicus ATCC BAA-2122 TaxID=796620 RepID=E3BQC1_9VIBR|nr:PepSY domain-containing protein [Vibrio caribbeanicus]EFP94745.1 hypothetical protein VIBC2010_13511 [Vibrio caribbeanicus ATCC BAA-2122]
MQKLTCLALLLTWMAGFTPLSTIAKEPTREGNEQVLVQDVRKPSTKVEFDDNHIAKEPTREENGHALVQDVRKPGTKVEFDDDQDEVYEAVQKGYVKPFSEMYAAVERDLKGRIIKVELEEDDGIWIYELKLNHENNIIKVEYNAQTLKMLEIKGRDFKQALKK